MDDHLQRLAAEHGFEAFVPILQKYAQPCVGFSLQRGAAGDIGSSRFGGGADVPADFVWPKHGDAPLDFLLQVNLADLAGFEGARSLPRQGLLAFFYDVEQQPWGFDPKDLDGYHVAYFPPGTQLQRVGPHREDVELPLATLKFWPALSLPSGSSRAFEPLNAELEREEAPVGSYWEFAHAVARAYNPDPKAPMHQLCGHSDNVQGDMMLEAELVMNGLYAGDPSGYKDPRAVALREACHQWRLLLQLDSEDDVMWGDLGMLYYWIRESDLTAGDFTKTWMGLQCS